MVSEMKEILNQYTQITGTDIEMFISVYYPIAIVEMSLDEMTFEDFDAVQLPILRLFSLGQTKSQDIADLMGLSPNYVYRVLNLLRGYGLIDDNGVTELGSQSLEQEKRITKARTLQIFQVDALNGNLIRIDNTILDSVLIDKKHTNVRIGHLDYLEGITFDSVNQQISQNYGDLIRKKSSILHTNVLAINDVKCLEIKYARSMMIKFCGCNEPIIFTKRINQKERVFSKRFSWQPFSVPDETFRQRYGFGNEIPLSSNFASYYIKNTYELILDQSCGVDFEVVYRALKKVYPFDEAGITFSEFLPSGPIIVNVTENAFPVYRSWIIEFLLDIQRYGEYLITNEHLYGRLIIIRPTTKKINKVANRLSEIVKTKGRSYVSQILRDNLQDFESIGETLIDKLAEELEKLKNSDVDN